MKYPIVILIQKNEELGREIERILNITKEDNYTATETRNVLIILEKKSKDLFDAIDYLEKLSTIDENYPAPKEGDSIKQKK